MTHVTVTSSARNAGYAAFRCTESVQMQTHKNLTHIYIDAQSTDGTYVHACAGARSGTVRRAPSAMNALQNLLPVWRSLPPEEVVVWLDGDDWLAIDKAIEFVVEQHEAGAWATYGNFITTDGQLGFAAPVDHRTVRGDLWRTTHLKTFRAGLVQRMREDDFAIYDDGDVWGAWDQLVMLAAVEMAAERAVFMPRILYVYNLATSFEATCTPEEKQRELRAVGRIRSLRPYERLERL